MQKNSKIKLISYITINVILCCLVIFFVGSKATSIVKNITANIGNIVDRLDDVENHINLASAELSKTINTLNSGDAISSDLKIKAHKFVMLQLLREISLNVQKGYDASDTINTLSQYVDRDTKPIIYDLKQSYNSNIPANSVFITTITGLIENQNHDSEVSREKSARPLGNIIQITDIQDRECKNSLVLALDAVKNNNIEQALRYLTPISGRYNSLKSIIPSIQLKNSINTLLHQLNELVMTSA